MKFFSRYSPGVSNPTVIQGESMCCQSFKDECDINQIVSKPNYGINPLNPPTRKPIFDDFSSIELTDFQRAQTMLADAFSRFENLDSSIRARFDNDPAKLIDFCNDPNNIEEGIKLGIYEKTVAQNTQSPSNASETDISSVSGNGSANVSLDVNERTDTIQS